MKALALAACLTLVSGCATLESLEDMRRWSRVAGALDSVVAAQDAKEQKSAVCLEDSAEKEQALRITRLMGWEADPTTRINNDDDPCSYVRRASE